MKISIALCSFNGANFIADQLKSIKNQTRQPDEIVVCDDDSSDGTLEIVSAFRNKCSFSFRIYKNQFRRGSIKNFEKAIELCSGDVIVLADQDDVWFPKKIAAIEDSFETNPDVGYVFSDAELVNEDGLGKGQSLWENLGFNKLLIGKFINGEQLHCLFRKPIVTGATMAIRASLKPFIIPFPEDTFFVHDLWIALVASAINKHGLPLTEKLIMYRLHSAQQIGVKNKSLMALYKDVIKFNKDNFIDFVHAYNHLSDHLRHLHLLHNIEVAEPDTQIKLKILHLINRHEIHSTKSLSGLKLATKEILSGRYYKFSDSWKSILRDLFSGCIN